MKTRLLVLFMFGCSSAGCAQSAATTWGVKPYRALLVVERWEDLSSTLIDHEKDVFQPVAALLKAWVHSLRYFSARSRAP